MLLSWVSEEEILLWIFHSLNSTGGSSDTLIPYKGIWVFVFSKTCELTYLTGKLFKWTRSNCNVLKGKMQSSCLVCVIQTIN